MIINKKSIFNKKETKKNIFLNALDMKSSKFIAKNLDFSSNYNKRSFQILKLKDNSKNKLSKTIINNNNSNVIKKNVLSNITKKIEKLFYKKYEQNYIKNKSFKLNKISSPKGKIERIKQIKKYISESSEHKSNNPSIVNNLTNNYSIVFNQNSEKVITDNKSFNNCNQIDDLVSSFFTNNNKNIKSKNFTKKTLANITQNNTQKILDIYLNNSKLPKDNSSKVPYQPILNYNRYITLKKIKPAKTMNLDKVREFIYLLNKKVSNNKYNN